MQKSEFEIKYQMLGGLVTNTALNTKIREVEKKNPNHDKYITTNDFNKFSGRNIFNTVEQCAIKNEEKNRKITDIMI